MQKPFPSLFGRFTAMRRDHRELAPLLLQVRELCAGFVAEERARESGFVAPPTLLAALYMELARHFAAEDCPAYFGAVAAERPVLAPRVTELRADHARMLELAAALVDLASDPSKRENVGRHGLELLEQLREHEARETQLLGEFLSHHPH